MKFFGPSKYLKPDETHVKTPVGRLCVFCQEPFAEGDMGFIDVGGSPQHQECCMRSIIGSVAHQLRRCTCFGGAEEDPPGMSVREAAIAAARMFEARQRGVLTYKILHGPGGPSIKCLRCGSESHNAADIQNLYCGRCHCPHAGPPFGVL